MKTETDVLLALVEYSKHLRCDRCKASVATDGRWRYDGKHWQHNCPDLPAICGHIGLGVAYEKDKAKD